MPNQNDKQKFSTHRIVMAAVAVLLLVPALVLISRWSGQKKSSVAISPTSTPLEEAATKQVTAPADQGASVNSAQVTSTKPALTQELPAQALPTQALPKNEPETTKGCVTITYLHRKTAGHSNEENCFQHKNIIRLKHENASSICVRVNNVPVPFDRGKNGKELIIGTLAGPKSQITARYCFGKAKCDENCTIPKDEFMDALGGSDKAIAQWDPQEVIDKDSDINAHLDPEMKKELDRLDRVEATVFADWISGAETPACGTQQARM